MMRSICAALVVGCYWLSSLPSGYAANSFQTYAIEWNSVPTTPTIDINLTSSCICALLGSGCTPNCCCDPACPASVVGDFKAAGSCLPEGPPPEQLAYCTPDEPFAKINLPAGDFYRIQKAPAGADFITQLLCIAADHNPSLGLQYPDQPAGEVGTNAQQAACQAAASTAAAATTSYSYGQALVVSAPSSSSVGGRVRGPLTLPVAAISAECLDVQQVGMLTRLPASLKESASSCQRTISSAAALTTLCNDPNSPLSPTYYGQLQFPPSPASSLLKAINVTAISQLNSATGALTALDPANNLTAPVAAAGPPATCKGVVLEAHFLFRHDTTASSTTDSSSSQLAASHVKLVIGDVVMPAAGDLVFKQKFSVQWANTTATDTTLLPLSGAPGYLPGFPLLAGVATTTIMPAPPAGDGSTKKAIARLAAGYTLPGAASAGRCSASIGDAVSVGFGYNTTSSCGIGMTRAQLKTFCTANDPTQTLSSLLGGWLTDLTSEQVMLGIWGNSDPANINQWVTLKSSDWPPAVNLEWDEATSTCNKVVTGFNLNLLTGVAWAAGNLQSKVLYGQMCFAHGSWSFNEMTGPSLQIFPLQFTANFVPTKEQQPVLELKPAPPLMVPLPPDLFYPFMTSASTQIQAFGWLHLVLLASVALVASLL